MLEHQETTRDEEHVGIDGETAQTHKDLVSKNPIPKLDYRIADDALSHGGAKTKYGYNIAAIRTLQSVEAENRMATAEEQEVLSRYVGWGGIPQAFNAENTSWVNEYTELKQLLTERRICRSTKLHAERSLHKPYRH